MSWFWQPTTSPHFTSDCCFYVKSQVRVGVGVLSKEYLRMYPIISGFFICFARCSIVQKLKTLIPAFPHSLQLPPLLTLPPEWAQPLPLYSSRASQLTLVVKNLPASAGDLRDMGLIPTSGRSPGGGHGNLLQYSCLETPLDGGA